ncbi:MAG TPA: helix-turn-helix domain-containing protein [Candidatus Angelobacter sp.]|nr:helix-turn-helix domain-containing protein [Candidatus Angelobacter sp.]
MLGVSDKHIYELAADGTLPAFHVGRSVRLDPQDVADWLRGKMPIFTERSAEEPSPKHKTRAQDMNTNPAYRILRSKALHLEAAATIERDSK